MNRIGFVVCSLIGYLLGRFLPQGAWSAYAPILISYHLYLVWLVIIADHETGFSMPVTHTILTHAAFLAALVGLAVGRNYVPFFGLIRIFVPSLAPFEFKMLLSGGMAKKQAPQEAASSEPLAIPAPPLATGVAPPVVSSETAPQAAIAPEISAPRVSVPQISTSAQVSASPQASRGMGFVEPDSRFNNDDHNAWVRYLAQPRRAFRKPGTSVEDEFNKWLAARAQLKALVGAQNQTR
jgi:hypothetical protein